LTAGVDTQGDRLEYEVVGWGRGEQSWGIEYGLVMGKPDQASTWQALSDKLIRYFTFLPVWVLKLPAHLLIPADIIPVMYINFVGLMNTAKYLLSAAKVESVSR